MNEVMTQIVRPALKDFYIEELFVGSTYELSGLSQTSDYDIQVFMKMPAGFWGNTGPLEWCDKPGWRKIRGGPADLIDSNGYLSTFKVSICLFLYPSTLAILPMTVGCHEIVRLAINSYFNSGQTEFQKQN